MIDLKFMQVWNNFDNNKKYKRWVISQFDGGCIAINSINTPDFNEKKLIDEIRCNLISLIYWEHCGCIKKELSAVVKSAEEITGIPGVKNFKIETTNYVWSYYSGYEEKRIMLEKYVHDGTHSYDYCSESCFWLKNWLKDFKEIEI